MGALTPRGLRGPAPGGCTDPIPFGVVSTPQSVPLLPEHPYRPKPPAHPLRTLTKVSHPATSCDTSNKQ